MVWSGHTCGAIIDSPAAGSRLTACTWFIGQVRQIRIYYRGQDGYIREAACDFSKGWIKSTAPTIQDFPRARNSTRLAIVSFPNTDESEAKLYYQSMDGKLMSYDYKLKGTFKDSWQNQGRGFSHPTFENGYKISTKKIPSNSKRRPWICTRRSGPYCRSQ